MSKDQDDKTARLVKRIKASCALLEEAATAKRLTVSVPLGETYVIPETPGLPPPHIAHAIIEGWSVCLSCVQHTGGVEHWQASARLHPRGRSSTVEDWDTLGLLTGIISHGEPSVPEQLISQVEHGDPNAVKHWLWIKGLPEAKVAS